MGSLLPHLFIKVSQFEAHQQTSNDFTWIEGQDFLMLYEQGRKESFNFLELHQIKPYF
jgi:hypothetical protein